MNLFSSKTEASDTGPSDADGGPSPDEVGEEAVDTAVHDDLSAADAVPTEPKDDGEPPADPPLEEDPREEDPLDPSDPTSTAEEQIDPSDPTSTAEEPGEDSEDLDEIEAALAELAEQMSVLSQNFEEINEARGDIEAKVENVEKRMVRLGSLAEAVSSQYNPFLSGQAPEDPIGLEPDGPPGSANGGSGPGEQAPAESPGFEDPAGPPPQQQRPPQPAERDPQGQSPQGKAPQGQSPQGQAPQGGATSSQKPRRPDAEPAGSAPESLEDNMLMLEWVGLVTRRVGRAGLMDLFDYYEGLGWLDEETKERAIQVAAGVDAPDREGDTGWRADVDLHRRSLLAIQRLQGKDVRQVDLQEMDLDLRRLFEG